LEKESATEAMDREMNPIECNVVRGETIVL